MSTEKISSTPSSPVLTGTREPTNESQVDPLISIETINRAPVRQEALEAHSHSLDRSSRPSTSYLTTSTLAAWAPQTLSDEEVQHTSGRLATEQDIKDMVYEKMGDWAKGFADRIQAHNDQLVDGLKSIRGQVRELTESMEETDRYLEKSGERIDATLARIAARQAERRRKKEEQNKDLDPNQKT